MLNRFGRQLLGLPSYYCRVRVLARMYHLGRLSMNGGGLCSDWLGLYWKMVPQEMFVLNKSETFQVIRLGRYHSQLFTRVDASFYFNRFLFVIFNFLLLRDLIVIIHLLLSLCSKCHCPYLRSPLWLPYFYSHKVHLYWCLSAIICEIPFVHLAEYRLLISLLWFIVLEKSNYSTIQGYASFDIHVCLLFLISIPMGFQKLFWQPCSAVWSQLASCNRQFILNYLVHFSMSKRKSRRKFDNHVYFIGVNLNMKRRIGRKFFQNCEVPLLMKFTGRCQYLLRIGDL